MTDLSEFLLARIAEDETDARDASWRSAEWGVAEHPARWGEDPNETVLADGKPLAELSGGGCALAAEHIARWDPSRVLAECEAKRRIVERYQRAQAAVDTDQRRVDAGGYSDERGTVGGWDVSALRPVLHLLAVPYADHPDYRQEWKP